MTEPNDEMDEQRLNQMVSSQMDMLFGHFDPLDPTKMAEPEYFDESEYYRNVMEPKFRELQEECHKHGIPFVGIVLYARTKVSGSEDELGEDYAMMAASIDSTRASSLQRGIYAVMQDSNNWSIGPSIAMALDSGLKDLLGGLADDNTNG